jgi:hypothetical protein
MPPLSVVVDEPAAAAPNLDCRDHPLAIRLGADPARRLIEHRRPFRYRIAAAARAATRSFEMTSKIDDGRLRPRRLYPAAILPFAEPAGMVRRRAL